LRFGPVSAELRAMKSTKTKAGTRTRFSRDLAIALKRADAALKKAAAAAPKTRGSRDLKVEIERAKKAVKKATAIARTTRGSRDLKR
jgi:Trp operon repressor